MSRYTEISWQEMHDFLVSNRMILLNPRGTRPDFMAPEDHLPEIAQGLERTWEMVYGRRVNTPDGTPLTIRVYTTITTQGQRDKGADAIRIALFAKQENNPPILVGGDRKVLRVKGWRKNLQSRLDKWPEMIGPACPKCGKFTVKRNGRNGSFWGCINFKNGCKGTMPINGENQHA